MAANKYIPVRRLNRTHNLYLEKHLLERHYSFLNTYITNNTLICIGIHQPTEYSANYKYEVTYKYGKHPTVNVISPNIEYNNDIHMYKNNSLCLYYPKDYSFTHDSHLYNTIIPWTHEWFVYYELYLITGIWQHPYVKHNKI